MFPRIKALGERGLPPVVSPAGLGLLFGLEPGRVAALASGSADQYRTFTIRTGSKRRVIHAPNRTLKRIQRWIGAHLARVAPLADCVHGFVPGRSAPGAAAVHCGATWVYSLDLADFFPSVPRARVVETLVHLGYHADEADLVAGLACLDGGLAQGAPSSPVLANLVLAPLDAQLQALARQHGARYTRYADDLVFSGPGEPPADLAATVRGIVEADGWRIAAHKEHLARAPHPLVVHGLHVHGPRPRLPKATRNRLRALAHRKALGLAPFGPPAPVPAEADESVRREAGVLARRRRVVLGHLAHAHAVDLAGKAVGA